MSNMLSLCFMVGLTHIRWDPEELPCPADAKTTKGQYPKKGMAVSAQVNVMKAKWATHGPQGICDQELFSHEDILAAHRNMKK